MAISTQRIIIIFFAMNILIGIATTIYQNPTNTTEGFAITTQKTSQTNQQVTDFDTGNTKYSGITSGLTLQETTVGNPITTSALIWSIMTNGFNPFSITSDQAQTSIEATTIIIFTIIKSMIDILLIYELYIVLKNKKTS